MKIKILIIFALALLFFISCKKSEFLNAKPNEKQVVPETLRHFQAILDNDQYMNGTSFEGLVPGFGEVSSDNYYIAPEFTIYLDVQYLNLYKWLDDIYTGEGPFFDWDYAYRSVFYANVVLDGLKKIDPTTVLVEDYNRVKGSALFYRAHIFYQLAQVFGQPFKEATANNDLGIPLRLVSDVAEPITRSTVQATYDRILSDLKESISLLPDQSLYKTRPSKSAVYGLLARIYQTLNLTDSSINYANSYLQLKSTLLNFNSLDVNMPNPIPMVNDETAFYCDLGKSSGGLLLPFFARVDSNLYNSYDGNDLRETMFFADAMAVFGTPGYYFRGSYSGKEDLFAGIATDEIMLIRSEAYARKGEIANAMNDLNALLEKRFTTGTFIPLTAGTSQEALTIILRERRKELLFRGLRWTDLRRLNAEGAGITITRKLDGNTFSLLPDSKHYTFLIPPSVINYNPSMPQTPR